jgi:HEAT repeat protein
LKHVLLKIIAACSILVMSSVASAANYVYYVPSMLEVGSSATEVYVPATFSAHSGLGGQALADACRKELETVLPGMKGLYSLKYQGLRADVQLAVDKLKDMDARDRLLGALFHSLKSAGFKQVTLNKETLNGNSFSRGAALVVLTLAEALPPQRLSYGMVRIGASITTADEFYARLSAGDQPIRDAYRSALSSSSSDVKLRLLGAISELRIKDKTPTLLPLLRDADVRVRMAVIKRLKATREPKVILALELLVKRDSDNDIKIAAVKILVKAGKKQYSKYLLLEKLKSPDASVIVDASKKLIEINDTKLATAFRPLVKHTNPQVRAIGVQGLGHFRLFDMMAGFLDDTKLNRDVTEAAAQVLSTNAKGNPQARGISYLLVQGAADSAKAAAKIAGEKRIAGVTKALGQSLTRSEADVRAAAAKALGQLKDIAGLEALALALRSTSQPEERAIFTREAIAIISVQPLSQVISISNSPDVTIKELAIKSLSEFSKDRPNPRAIEVLRKKLSDPEISIRRAAVYALARIKNPQILDDLIKMKGDPDEQIRAQVVYAVSRSQHPGANKLIITFVDDAKNTVKQAAVQAIRERGLKEALNKLKNLVEYRHDGVRYEVIRAIAELTPEAEPGLFDLFNMRLGDLLDKVKILAIDELAKYTKDPRTALAIGAAVTDRDKSVRLHAINVLSKSEDPNAPEQVIRGLFDRDRDVRLAALNTLAVLKSDKAIKALSEIIKSEKDEEVRKRAEEVMSNL